MEKKPAEGGALPPIPPKRYFTIGEVAQLMRRQTPRAALLGARIHPAATCQAGQSPLLSAPYEVLLVRRIRHLLYDEGYTIAGARHRLGEEHLVEAAARAALEQLRTRVQQVRGELESLLGQLRS